MASTCLEQWHPGDEFKKNEDKSLQFKLTNFEKIVNFGEFVILTDFGKFCDFDEFCNFELTVKPIFFSWR